MVSGVQFEEEKIGGLTDSQFQANLYRRKPSYSPTVAFVVRVKLFKTEGRARMFILLLSLLVVCIGMYYLHGALQPPEIIELRVTKI